MKKYLILACHLLVSNFGLSQTTTSPQEALTPENTTTIVNTPNGMVKVEGLWEMMGVEKSSGQHYYKNDQKVVLAVAKNLKKSYSFYKSKQSGYETVQAFTKWDLDYQKEQHFKTKILKENREKGYQIWKFTDANNIDNIFLYGDLDDSLLNLLIYTKSWTEEETISFLEGVYLLNKK